MPGCVPGGVSAAGVIAAPLAPFAGFSRFGRGFGGVVVESLFVVGVPVSMPPAPTGCASVVAESFCAKARAGVIPPSANAVATVRLMSCVGLRVFIFLSPVVVLQDSTFAPAKMGPP